MATLYRKYRPQNFAEVVGQNHIKVTLENEIQSGRIAHAYLFCGPRAVGKTTLARVMAKAVNCLKRKEGESEPCNQCEICEEITVGRNLDIMEIDAASHTGVDNVRENIITSARTSPSRCKYKVFIIDEVHMLSISAFNALLKIIEEPPANVIFILCTTEIHKVPTTIISRCQRFDFRRISVSDTVKKLNYIVGKEKIKIGKNILEAIARKSEGYMRDAEGLLGQIVSIGGREITQAEADLVIPRSDLDEIINLIGYLIKKDAAAGVRLVNKLVDEGVNLAAFTSDLVEVLRKIMLDKISAGNLALEFGETLEIKINEVSRELTLEQLTFFIERFIKVKNELKDSFIAQLPIELAITELCLAKEGAGKSAPIAPKPVVGASPKPAANPGEALAGIGLEEIKNRWHEVLTRVKKYNHSLSFILRVCQPRDIAGQELCLAFKYKFHKDRVSNIQVKGLVENILTEVYGQPLSIQAVIDETLEISNGGGNGQGIETEIGPEPKENGKPSQPENGNMLNDLLKTFGGRIVK
ncbi:MAG: DNA polymerase III subunit gamma/tau [Patescibacteria group bacterium]|nr:DNA polymerase III subunit gamma/tau [Patescibacteria group bacterium]MDD5294980.1 DNA polymerase III subunit gamma/tau [Patescibacteria group bacterium]MDD5554771.1 DNA polymerase III subunit gamma/tau [Patescibacteria group bacterium]